MPLPWKRGRGQSRATRAALLFACGIGMKAEKRRQWVGAGMGRTMTIDRHALGFGYGERAVYAADPWRTRGRLFSEGGSPTRSDFQRDRDRIVHTTAFRRLKHKTQVFIAQDGDHYRTRLTHTIEV